MARYGPERVVLSADDIDRALARIAYQLIETNRGADDLVLIGVPTRGVPLARRLGGLIEEASGHPTPVGQLDITLYRDDLRRQPTRTVMPTSIPCDIDGRVVVLVDDVLYSGRTVAAALDALKDYGRPRRIQLAVLVDRGHRELPIAADVVGKELPTRSEERVQVRLSELDGTSQVSIMAPESDSQ
ncbi:MAG: bifunctional pyr operon transcriptional regulator/uracil phosphoribosyltransferase PyrR [Propionibacteriaceae bacterium]|jgi:pyrimidine operon attenuation protein/uracil phosphoribosyltransferase|nr:bifunctional pyr operon transcriptional regulator/uracil phosphoribosyltransferase PyrR [Propionibacteriaceae bacterium]